MDNRTIDVTSQGQEGLAGALRLIWPNTPSGKASHYKMLPLRYEVEYFQNDAGVTTHHFEHIKQDSGGVPTLLLLWSAERDAIALPYPLDLEGATAFVAGWLDQVEYGREPDQDGSNEKGWRVFTGAWGHVAGHRDGICAIQPAWAMYGN